MIDTMIHDRYMIDTMIDLLMIDSLMIDSLMIDLFLTNLFILSLRENISDKCY